MSEGAPMRNTGDAETGASDRHGAIRDAVRTGRLVGPVLDGEDVHLVVLSAEPPQDGRYE